MGDGCRSPQGQKGSTFTPLIAGALLWVLGPSLVWAQTPEAPARGAGVVTNLAGQVTVARRVIPQPIPLKFKDAVFVADTVRTAKQSLARLLLGGKAVVTVRELSELVVSEEAGRSMIDVAVGRLGVTVARERMQPGEALMIRTPNAIAAVRGTIFLVEVTKSLSLFGQPQFTTTFSVLDGSVEVGTRAAPAKTITAGSSQSITISQDKLGALTPLAGVASLYEVLKTPFQHMDVPEKTKTRIDESQEGNAVALAEFLAPPPSGVIPNPIQPATQAQAQVVSTTPNTGGPPITPEPADQPDVTVSQNTVTPANAFKFTTPGGQVQLDSGQSAKTYSGTTNRTVPSPVVLVDQSTVSQAGADPFVQVTQGANATLAGPVLGVSNSTLTPGTNLLSVQGSLTSTSPSPLISLDPSTITTPSDLIHIAGGSLTVAGPLLTDQGGTLTIGGAVVRSTAGGQFTNGAGPLVQLNGSSLAAETLISTDGQGNQLNLTGTLLDMTNATATLGAVLATGGTDTVTRVLGPGQPDIQLTTSQLALTGNGALGGTIAVGAGSTLEFRSGTQTSTATITGPGTVLFSGGTVNLNGGTYNITGTSTQITGGTANFNPGVTLVSLGLVTITGGTLNLNSGKPISLPTLTLQGSTTFGGADPVTVTGALTKSGIGTTSTVNAPLLTTGNVTVNSGTLALLGGGTHSGDFSGPGALELAGGHTFAVTSDITASDVVFSGSTTNIAGPYVLTGSSTTVSSGTVNFTHPSNKTVGALTISGGTANFSGTPGGPFDVTATTLSLSNLGTLTGSDNLTASGAMTWSGGTMSGTGTTTISGGLTINGSGTKTLSRPLTNTGPATVSGTGPFQITSGVIVTSSGPFSNAGTVDVQSGTLALTGGGTHSGIFQGAGTLDLSGGHTLQNGSAVTVTNVIFSGGATTIDGTYNLLGSSTTVNGGTVTFNPTATVTNLGPLAVTGGTLTLNSGEAVTVPTLAFTNPGPATLTGTDAFGVTGATTKAGAGTATIGLPFNNTGGVTVNAGTLSLTGNGTHTGGFTLTAGTLQFGGGTHELNVGALLSGAGTVQVTGATVNANVSGVDRLTGTLGVTAGTLTVNGDLVALKSGETLSPTGTMVTVSGGSLSTVGATSDLVEISGTGALNTGGPVLTVSTGGTITLGGAFLNKSGAGAVSFGGVMLNVDNATVTATGTGSLFDVTGGTLTNSGGIRAVNSTLSLGTSASLFATSNGASVTVNGSTLDLTNTSLNVGAQPFSTLSGGSTLTVSPATAAFRIAGGSFTADALLIMSGGTPNNLVRTGPLFDLTNATVTLRSITDFTPATDTISITLGSGQANVRMTDSNFTLTNTTGDALSSLGGLNVAPLTHAGVALIATNTGGTAETISLASPLARFGNQVTLTATDPQVQLTGMTVNQSGTNGLIELPASVAASIAGPLLNSVTSTLDLSSARHLLFLDDNASLTATGAGVGALMGLSGGSVTTGQELVVLHPNSTLTLNRTFLSAANTVITGGANFPIIAMDNSASLTVGGHLFDLTNTNLDLTFGVSPDQPLVQLAGNNTLTLGGSFLKMNGGTVTVDSLGVGDATTTLIINSSKPFVDLTNATVTTTNTTTGVADFGTTTATLAAGTPIARMDNSSFTMAAGNLSLDIGIGSTFGISTGALALIMTNNSTLVQNEGGLVDFQGGGAATATATVPLVQVTGSTLNLNGANQHALVRARDAGTAGIANGPFLTSTNSTINLNGDANLLWVDDGASLTRTGTGTGATFQFSGGALNVANETVLIRPGASLVLNNPLIDASGTTFNLGTDAAFTDAAFTITALNGSGATLTSSATSPLLSFNGGALTTQAGEDLMHVGRTPGDGVASVNLSGGILKLQNIAPGTFTVGSGTLISVTGGSSVTAGGPTLDLIDATFTLAGYVLRLADGSSFSNTAGPRFSLTNSSLGAKALARIEGTGNVQNFTGPLLEVTNSTVTVEMVAEFGPGATVTISRTLGAGESFFSVTNSTLSLTAGNGTALVVFGNQSGGPLNQAGVALRTAGPVSAINLTTSSLVGLFGGAGGVTYTDPASSLVQLASTTVTQTGDGAPLVAVPVSGGSVTVQSTAPLVSVANSTINSTGTSTPSGLLTTSSFTTFTLNGPLVETTASTLSLSGAVLVMAGQSTLVSNTINPFIELTGGGLTLGLRGVFLNPGSQATLQGPLFRANGTTITVGSSTPVPFIELNRTAAPTSLTIGGPIVDLTNTTLNLLYGPGTGDDQAVVRLTGGSAIASTAGPNIRVSNSSILADALFTTDGASNSLGITGSFLELSNNAVVTVRSLGSEPPGGGDTFTVTLAADQPFYAITNSTLTVPQGESDLCIGCGEIANSFPGRVLVATNSTITFGTGGLFNFEGGVNGATISGLGLVGLTNAVVNLTDPVNSTPFGAHFAGTKGTLGGPLFVMNSGSALNIANGVLLEVTTGATLEVIGNGKLGQFLDSASRLNVTHGLTCGGNCVDLPNTSFKILVTNGGATLLDPVFQPFVVSDGTLDNEIRINNGVGDQILIRVDGNGSTLQLSATAAAALVLPPDQTFNTTQTFSSAQHGLAGAGGILDGSGTVFVQGLYQWESGTMQGSGTTVAQGGLTLGGNVTLNRGLLLAGTSQILGDFTVAGTGTLSNAGTLTKTAGAGLATINLVFTNTGTLNVNTGSLLLVGGGANSGTMTVAGGTTLGFGVGTYNLNAGSFLSGAGEVLLGQATVNLNVSGVDRLTGRLGVFDGTTLTANGDVIALGTGETLAPSGTAIDVGGSGNLALVGASSDVVHLTGTATFTAGGTVLAKSGAGSATVGGHVLHVGGGTVTGPAGGNVTAVTAGNFDTVGSLVKVTPGGSVILPSTAAVASINGGTAGNPQSLAAGTGAAMFDLAGNPANTMNEVVNLGPTLGNATVTVGTDRPIKGPGVCPSCVLNASLLETGPTTTVISGGRVLKVNTALLEASLPLLNLKAGATMTLSANAFDLSLQAKVVSLGPQFVKIDGSVLTINVGALANVAGGSYLNILGDFLHLTNNATLTLNDVNDGFLLKASGGSVVQIEKGLVNFENGPNNLVEVKNNKAPSATLNGITFFFSGGATAAQVEVLGTPIKNPAQGSITFPNSGSHILVDGLTTKVQIKGN